MSEWKNRVKRHNMQSEDFCYTGWGMSDGFIKLVDLISKRLREKKKVKTQ